MQYGTKAATGAFDTRCNDRHRRFCTIQDNSKAPALQIEVFDNNLRPARLMRQEFSPATARQIVANPLTRHFAERVLKTTPDAT